VSGGARGESPFVAPHHFSRVEIKTPRAICSFTLLSIRKRRKQGGVKSSGFLPETHLRCSSEHLCVRRFGIFLCASLLSLCSPTSEDVLVNNEAGRKDEARMPGPQGDATNPHNRGFSLPFILCSLSEIIPVLARNALHCPKGEETYSLTPFTTCKEGLRATTTSVGAESFSG